MESIQDLSRCSLPPAHFNQVVMVMFTPSQSHSGGVIVKPYTGNIAQEYRTEEPEEKKKKTKPILRLGSPWQPSKNQPSNKFSRYPGYLIETQVSQLLCAMKTINSNVVSNLNDKGRCKGYWTPLITFTNSVVGKTIPFI